VNVESLLWALDGTVLHGSLLVVGSCKTRREGYGTYWLMDVSAFVNGDIMPDLFCPPYNER